MVAWLKERMHLARHGLPRVFPARLSLADKRGGASES